MFGRIVKTELRKATGNRWFLTALSLGLVLAAISFIATLQMDLVDKPFVTMAFLRKKYYTPSASSVYAYWMLDDAGRSSTDLFFLLLPLLAALPYSWSLLSERTSGYASHILARAGRPTYLAAKHCACFVSGGLVVAVPVLLNFLACICIAPFYDPDVAGVVVFGVYEQALWSWFFYNEPALYSLFRVLLIFFFSGLWAVFVMSLSFFIKKRVALLVVPYLSLILLKYLDEYIIIPRLGFDEDLTPFGYLRNVPPAYYTGWLTIAIELALLLAFVGVVHFKARRADEL